MTTEGGICTESLTPAAKSPRTKGYPEQQSVVQNGRRSPRGTFPHLRNELGHEKLRIRAPVVPNLGTHLLPG